MARSGIYTRAVKRDVLLRDALRDAGKLSEYESATADTMEYAGRHLNNILNHIKVICPNLFVLRDIIIFPDPLRQKYILGDTPEATARACYAENFGYAVTLAPALAGSYEISVLAGDLRQRDAIGIITEAGIFWTEIFTIVGTVVTLLAPLPVSILAGTEIYAYSGKITKPMRIDTMTSAARYGIDGADTPVMQMPRIDYALLASKGTSAMPSSFVYTPLFDTGELFLWPVSYDGRQFLKATIEVGIETMNAANDDFSLPDEWISPVQTRLAAALARQDLPIELKVQKLSDESDTQFRNCITADTENASITIEYNDRNTFGGNRFGIRGFGF